VEEFSEIKRDALKRIKKAENLGPNSAGMLQLRAAISDALILLETLEIIDEAKFEILRKLFKRFEKK
jgi:hypothetical protein